MKTKRSFLMGAAFILIAAAVLAGCATTGRNGTPPSPDKLAERLAKDLNAIKAGNAAVEGATVRLTGEVYLTTSLTVPASLILTCGLASLRGGIWGGASRGGAGARRRWQKAGE
jgi:hypothetical protein